ncbi:unnamed protein product [Prorocentrum cordatum]|uniref:Selenoprotein W n=1 Tax=Prorocentrum cordatum TaxID=2364126 RepID=A0ABN9V9B2_9DINO|nr:unnamed protein product [Polarella glacialis]
MVAREPLAAAAGLLVGIGATLLAVAARDRRGRSKRRCGGASGAARAAAAASRGERQEEGAAATAEGTAAAAAPPAAVEIEYCVGCRWMLRAAWMAQELLSTFSSSTTEPLVIGRLVLVPNADKPGGVFRVRVNGDEVYDRKAQGGFPEAKVLKQLVRDHLAPQLNLGHSDKK